MKGFIRCILCLFTLLRVSSYLHAQTVSIIKPLPNQPFCGMEPFNVPVQGTLPESECKEDYIIEWSVTIEGKNFTTTTKPGEEGAINVTTPPTQNSSFGNVKVRAEAKLIASATQVFSGTGYYAGPAALRVTTLQAGQNYEGYIANNCDPNEQDMVIGQATNNLQAGTTTFIAGYCTDKQLAEPSNGARFGTPWTSESSSHWAYWERQAVIYANKQAYDHEMKLAAIWYISDRSGQYNAILSSIGYPINGPTKNFEVDFTPPTVPIVTDDGDSTLDTTQLHATWISQEFESGIVEYQYAIGTSRGAANVVDWTSAGGTPEVVHSGLSLEIDATYYFAVKAQNGAGLWSTPGFSDGIKVGRGKFSEKTVYNFPNPFSPESDGFTRITFILTEPGEVSLKIFDANGGLIWEEQKAARQGKNYTLWHGRDANGQSVANGVYFCRVQAQGTSIIKKIAVLR